MVAVVVVVVVVVGVEVGVVVVGGGGGGGGRRRRSRRRRRSSRSSSSSSSTSSSSNTGMPPDEIPQDIILPDKFHRDRMLPHPRKLQERPNLPSHTFCLKTKEMINSMLVTPSNKAFPRTPLKLTACVVTFKVMFEQQLHRTRTFNNYNRWQRDQKFICYLQAHNPSSPWTLIAGVHKDYAVVSHFSSAGRRRRTIQEVNQAKHY